MSANPPNEALRLLGALGFERLGEALGALVKSAVSEALAEQRQDPEPALLDRNALAKALGCSPSQVDRLRRVGLPWVRLGDVPRFELVRCLEWLRQRSSDEPSDV